MGECDRESTHHSTREGSIAALTGDSSIAFDNESHSWKGALWSTTTKRNMVG